MTDTAYRTLNDTGDLGERRPASLTERMGFRNRGRSGKALGAFLLFGSVGPLSGIVPYLFIPSETVALFGGVSSPSADFWCTLTASADATISFICASALLSESLAIKQLAIRAFWVYAISHFGIFEWWAFVGPLPVYWHAVLWSAIASATAALVLWGVPWRGREMVWNFRIQ